MKPTTTKKFKLLIAGAFFAFTQFAYGQMAPYAFFASNQSTSIDICEGDSALMNVFSLNSSSNTFKWFYIASGQSSVQVSTSSSHYASEPGRYEVQEFDINGNYVGSLSLYPSFESNSISLTTSSTTRSQLISQGTTTNAQQYPAISPTTYSANASNPNYGPAPWGYYTPSKAINQMLITKDELEDLGFMNGSTIESILFEIDQIGDQGNGDSQLREMLIKIGETSQSNMDSWFNGNFTTVFNDYWFYPQNYGTGWQEIGFHTPYVWNGSDNIVIQFSYRHYNGTLSTLKNPKFKNKEYTTSRSRWSINADVVDNIGTTSPFVTGSSANFFAQSSNFLPNIKFKVRQRSFDDVVVSCVPNPTLSIGSGSNYQSSGGSYLWSDGTNSNTLTASSQGTYWMEFTSALGCKASDTISLVLASSSADIIATDTSFCFGDSVISSITGANSLNTYIWSNGDFGTSSYIKSDGNITVTEIDTFGCSTALSQEFLMIDRPNAVYYKSNQSITPPSISGYTYKGLSNGNFIYRSNSRLSWTNALTEAQNLGGDLASFHSLQEWTQLLNWAECNDWVHTGLNDIVTEGTWVFSDGSNFNYTPPGWLQGEPNGGTGENVIGVYCGSNFNDYHQNNSYYYFVSIPSFNDGDALAECDSIRLATTVAFDSIAWFSVSNGYMNSLSNPWVTTDDYFYCIGYNTSNNCELISDTIQVQLNSTPSYTFTSSNGADLTGAISSTVLSVGGAPVTSTYLWSDGSTSSNLTVSTQGEYTVTITDQGCSVTESYSIYEPIFVAKTGDDTNGDGTFASPYLTIQKAINVSSSGDKIYVLPGTYEEGELDFETSSGSGTYKSLFIASDFVRLGNSSAIASTKIDANGEDKLFNIRGLNTSVIQGFTLTGQQSSQWESCVIYLRDGANVTFKDVEIKGNTWASDANCHVLYVYNSSPKFENALIQGHGNANNSTRATTYISGGNTNVEFTNVIWKDNFAWDYGVLGVWSGATVTTINNVFLDNGHANWRGIINIHNQSTVNLINTTVANNIYSQEPQLVSFWDASSTTTLNLVNSILGETSSEEYQIYNNGGNSAYVYARNTVLPFGTTGSNQPTKINWDVDGSNVFTNPQLNTNGTLKNNSPAIGLGSNSAVVLNNATYAIPTMDLAGVARPNPSGSNSDAGAYENNQAQGDFDILLSQCDYLLEATVLNTNAYTVAWLYDGDTVSTDESFLATELGSYSFYVFSTDRNDTLTESITLSNPLKLNVLTHKDNCSEVSTNNGYIYWGNLTGGVPYSTSSWEYRTGIDNENGTQFDGIWEVDEIQWYYTRNGMSAGDYYVWIEDATGCRVGDTVEILDQDQALYYVSNTGSDSNDGLTKATAFKTISYAVGQVCDLDQVVVLEGTYAEDSIVVAREIILASEIYEDGDTSHVSNTIIEGGDDWIMYWQGASSNSWSDTATSKIYGFTFDGGSNTDGSYAAGITLQDNRALKIQNSVFQGLEGNTVRAIYSRNYSHLSLQDVVIKNLTNVNSNSVLYNYFTYLHVDGLEIKNITGSYSAGILWKNHYGYENEFINIVLENNQNTNGSLLYWANPRANMEVENLSITGNTYNQDALYFYQGYPNGSNVYSYTFKNVLIASNTTVNNPGINANYVAGNLEFINLTIAENTVANPTYSFRYYPYSSYTNRLNILNSIIESNGTYAVQLENSNSTATIKNSLLTNGVSGINSTSTMTVTTSNIENGFANLDGDFMPTRYSRALGGGVASATFGSRTLTAPTLDIKGNVRPNPSLSNPDMGAVESPRDTFDIGIKTVVMDNGFCETADGEISVSTLNYTAAKTYNWVSLNDATWTYSTTDSVATGLSSGQYYVEVIDTANAVLGNDTVVVGTHSTIVLTDESLDAGCYARGDAQIAFNLSGGNPYGGSQYYYKVIYLDQAPSNSADSANSSGYSYTGVDYSMGIAGPASYASTSSYNVYQGKYYVEVSDVDGCSIDDTLTIGYTYDLPALTIKTYADNQDSALTSLCEGSSLQMIADASSAAGGLTYEWSTNATTQKITKSTSGEYYVTVRDANSCYKSDTVDIYFQNAPELVLEGQSSPVYNGISLPNYSAGFYIGNPQYLGLYEGNAYYLVQQSRKYAEAKEIAENLGGYLAEITSKEENQWVASKWTNITCCDAMIGANFNGSTWVNHDNKEISWSYWWGNEVNGVGNPLHGDPATDLYDMTVQNSSGEWINYQTNQTFQFIIEFPAQDAIITYNQAFCDSIELKVKPIASADDRGFTEIYWTDAQGDTVADTEYHTFYGDQDITLQGVFTRSDGQTCTISSNVYSFDVFGSPNLVVNNYSSSVDLLGGDTIVLAASTDAGTISWVDSAGTVINNDTLYVTQPGIYTARAATASCESVKEIQIYEPIYVAKTGDDTNGDGTFASPYLTIQKAINVASSGDKIYVLPGTYSEGELDFETSANSGFYKSVYIASDFVRTDDASAISSTVIDADGSEYLIHINGSNSSTIQGFTLTGQIGGSDWEGALLRLNNGASLTFKNLVITGNYRDQSYSPEAQLMNVRYNSHPVFENVVFQNNGSSSLESRQIAFIYSNASAKFINCTWKNNYIWEQVVRVQNNSNALFENNVFVDNGAGDWGVVAVEESNCSIVFSNSTIVNNTRNGSYPLLGFSGSNNTIYFHNSILGNTGSANTQIRNNTSTTNTFIIRNSVLPFGTIGATNANKLTWDDNGSNVFADPQITASGTLKSNSPAIGLGSNQPFVYNNTTYDAPTTDLAGVARPNPSGSNSDAGAYENNQAIGDFDILLSQCGYLLEATVLNSNAYSVAWLYDGDTVATEESFIALAVGSYDFIAISTDRNDTIVESITLADPLRYDLAATKNNCTDIIGGNNGRIEWGRPQGGTPNSNNNYYSWVESSSGGYVWGNPTQEINHTNDWNGTHSVDGLSADTYYVIVSDATGCQTVDTVIIEDQAGGLYYVGNQGDNSNDGSTVSMAFATIEYALTQVCDEDTIIVLDGIYFEDSLEITRDLVLGSMYLIDGDTAHISNTIIDGEDDGWIMRWLAGSNSWSDTTSNQLVGLTIQNGNSTDNSFAGGLTVWDDRVLKVSQVRFISNVNNKNQGGGLLTRYNSRVELTNVLFKNNEDTHGGAGLTSSYTYLRMLNAEFVGNYSSNSGAAMWIDGSKSFYTEAIEVHDHDVPSNDLIYIQLYSLSQDAIMKNWHVHENSSAGRTMRLRPTESSKKLTIENMLFADNVVNYSVPGIWLREFSGTINIINSTFANNTTNSYSSNKSGAAVVFEYAYDDPTVNIWNSIVSHNTDYSIAQNNNYSMTLNVENSFVNGGTSKISMESNGTKSYGTTNLSSGLYFTDAANGDYSLSSVSTLLGAGATSTTVGGVSLVAPTLDLYGNPRPNPAGTNPDLGAIEGVDSTAQVGIAAVITNNGFCQSNSGAITANLLNYNPTSGSNAVVYSWSSSSHLNWTWNNTQTATNLASGDYKVIASNASTGEKIDSMEVTVSTVPSISILNTSTDVTCFSDDDGELSFEISGGNPLGGSQYTYSIDYLQNLAQASGVKIDGNFYDSDNNSSSRSGKYISDNWNGNPNYQGKYYVSVSDQDGCTFTDTVEIGYKHELPQVNVTTLASDGTVGLTSMCTGGTISLTANVTGGGGTNSYAWSNASTAQTVGVAQSDEYYVEVTDQYTCVGRDTVDIYFQSAPQLVIENGNSASFTGQALTGSYSANATYLGEHENHHYYMVQNGQSWTTAKAAAEALGGYLAIPNDAAENNAINTMIANKDVREEAWLGIYWNGSVWLDVKGNPLTYTNWWGSSTNTAQHQSYDDYPYASKAYWSGDWYNQWKWDNRSFIIEFGPTDAPVVYNQNFCDSVELKATPFIDSTDPGFTEVYWTDANTGDTLNIGEYGVFTNGQEIILKGEFVRSDGSSCVMNSSVNKFGVFGSPEVTFTTYDSLSGQFFSGSDISACLESELYTTAIGSSDTTNTFTYLWSTGETDSIIELSVNGTSMVTLTDVLGCSTQASIDLFKKSEPVVGYSAVVIDSAYNLIPNIPNFYFSGVIGNKYIFTSNYSTTWEQARQDALNVGGDLASYSSEAEYNTLTTFAWTDMFIGLNDVASEGIWEFSDGSPVTYFPPNWGVPGGQPDNAGNNEDYVTINSWGGYNDIDQWSQNQFLIQIPIPPTEVELASGEAFCDSVTLFALGYSTADTSESFTKVYWRDASNGAKLDSTESLTIEASIDLYLEGFFTQSNGSECSVIGDTISVIINQTPDLTVFVTDSTYEMLGDSLTLVAYSSNTSAALTWTADTTSYAQDTLIVYERGTYVATASENGCSMSEEIFIDKPLFVSKATGSDITGTGSINYPYKTIQYAIDTAVNGQKIYVLPGTYNEKLMITKGLTIVSDFVRLGNTSALGSTIIKSGTSGQIQRNGHQSSGGINIVNANGDVRIEGFTIKDFQAYYDDWEKSAAIVVHDVDYDVLFENLVITNVTQNMGQPCCPSGFGVAVNYSDKVTFKKVDIIGNGNANNYVPRFGWIRSGKVELDQVKFYQNYVNDFFFELENGSELTMINSIVSDYNQGDHNFYPIRVQSNSKFTSINSTFNKITSNNDQTAIYMEGSNSEVVLLNTVVNAGLNSAAQVIRNNGSSNELVIAGSVIPVAAATSLYGVNVTIDSSTVVADDVLTLAFAHKSSSPGIGIGHASYTWNGTTYMAPEVDIYDSIRPIPVGSILDAGAIESQRAQGDFDISVADCGMLLTVTVLNSDHYDVLITGPASFVSSEEATEVPILGLYTVSVYDSISGQTLTESVNINDPLEIGYATSKNSCAASGGYGEIITGDYQGGTRFNIPNDQYWAYSFGLTDTTGTNYLGTNNHVPDNNGHRDYNTLQPGVYVASLTDATGCTVRDTLVIEDVQQSMYYISTTGSDTADGTASSPLATITEALGRACDGDTIVLYDGEYFENVFIDNSQPFVTIASEMILDNDDSHIAATKVNGMDEDPVFEVREKSNSSNQMKFYGFTATNGKANSNWYGGGGFSVQNSDIEFENMLITGNRSGNSGGGIGIENSQLTISNTIIENNLATYDGGGVYLTGVADIDAIGSVIIRNNKADSQGGGIAWNGHWDTQLSMSNITIENNEAQNSGGGLYAQNGWWNNNATVVFENLLIRNNRAGWGAGGAHINGSGNDLILQNTVIAFNKSNDAGGLSIENADLDIIHTTIYKNGVLNATTSNDQIKMSNNANVLFLNSAVGGQEAIGASTAHTFYLDDWNTTCDLVIESSIISGGTSTIDNPNGSTITGTPIGQSLYLQDPANGDYMLSPVSSGLGAGIANYTGVVIPALDFMGAPRPGVAGQNPDVGAVESPLGTAEFGAAYEIRNNIACDPTYGRLKVIPLNGSGAYQYDLVDIDGTTTFSTQQNIPSYVYSSLYSGRYEVTITDLGITGNPTFVDTVVISGKDSLSLTKDIANEFCAGEMNGSISLSVQGGDGFYDYTWSSLAQSNLPNSPNQNNLGPGQYFVTVKDGDNCFYEDSVTIVSLHTLPVVSITASINKGGGVVTTSTNPIVRACAGDQVTLDAGAGFIQYNWTTVDQLNSWSTQTLNASYEEGFYVTAIDSFGCSNTDSAQVFYVQSPSVYASNVNTNIGASMQSVTSYVEGISQRLGTGYNDAKPYGAQEPFAKMQFIIPASELIAVGLTDQTTINSIGFEVEVESGSPLQGFKVKMKNTTANQVSNTFETGLTQVYSLNILTPGEGWNTHTLNQGFTWDGTKNLLVQVEYSNIAFSGGMDHLLMGADMSYNASSVAKGYSSVANSTQADFTSTWRPNMKFGIDKVQATDTLRVCDFTMLNTTDDYDTYSWLVGGVSQSSMLRYSVSSPVEVVLQTVDAASSCTMYSDTVQVLLDTTPTVFASSTSLLGCIGDSLTTGLLSVDTSNVYSWSNGVNDTVGLFTESGQYFVYATSPSGCQGVDTVDVNINIPPDVVVELNGRVLTSTDGSLVADNSSCDTTLILPYYTMVDTLSPLGSSEWSTYSNEYLEWEYQQGWDSLVDFTGPLYDADSNFTGGFYQFDPASLTDQNKEGYLQLGCVNLLGMGSPELTFEYHMVDVYADSANTADQMGSLALEVKVAGDANWNTLWQRSGTDPAYDWVVENVSLSSYVNKTIQLRWKGTAGVGGPRSEMGLDNIGISDSLALASNISGRATPETVCEGDSLFANTISNGTTNFSYLWNTGETTSGLELHNTGWYSVTVVDDKNCAVTSDSVYILVNPAPNNLLVVSDTTQYCEGLFDSLMISSTTGYDHYQWFINQGSGYVSADTTDALQVDSISTGSQQYYVMITDSLGCRSTSATVELVQTPTPVLTLTSGDVLCNGDSTGFVGVSALGSGQWIYNWSSGDTTSNVSNVPTDWYSVTVTDQYQCIASDSIFVGEPTAVALSVLSTQDVDCFGSSTGQADIDFTGGVGGYVFTWTDASGTWNSSNEDLANAPAGTYYVNAQDGNGCGLLDTVTLTEPTQLFFSVDSVLDLTCKGNMDGYIGVSASGGVLPYSFIANNDTNATGEFYNLDSNYYVLSVLDNNGCTVASGAVVSQPDPPYNGEEICVVSVDTTGVNLVVWEKTPGKRTAEYVVLTENASTQYVSIGTNQYADMSTFVDQNSNPAVRPYRYRLALMDSCGFYSDTSDYHATIHLQASQGVAQNEVQLQWTAYEGKQVQTYYIYRWLSPTTRVLVDSVSANVQTYTDIYPVNTTITALLYEVGAKFVDGGCSPTAGKQASYVTSMSNRLDWGTDGGLPIGTDEWVNVVLESDLGLFPNPTQGYLNVSMTGAWEQEENVQMKVLDITGRVIAQREIDHGGDVRFDFRELPAGVYFIHTMTERGRIIVKRFERIN